LPPCKFRHDRPDRGRRKAGACGTPPSFETHPQVEIAGEARNGEEALALIAELSPDLLFLDIQMPGMTGFELLDRLESVPQVIFTTAYDEHAIKAFEVNALDYLLKPIAPERLAAALQRVSPRRAPQRLSRVFVRDGDRCWIVRLPDIFLLESEGNYTRLHFGAERPLIRRSLNALEQQLDPAMFFRASRKQILNLTWIEKTAITVSGGLVATLRGGQTVEMSRRQSDRLREILSL
jgi:two-component system LytT family response regulator